MEEHFTQSLRPPSRSAPRHTLTLTRSYFAVITQDQLPFHFPLCAIKKSYIKPGLQRQGEGEGLQKVLRGRSQSLQQFLKEIKWGTLPLRRNCLCNLVTDQKEASDPIPKAQVKHSPVYETWVAVTALGWCQRF